MKREHISTIIIGCLFISTIYISYLYVTTSKRLVEMKQSRDLYEEIAWEFWAEEQIGTYFNESVHVNMISHSTYEVAFPNGTISVYEKYDQGWHKK